MKTLLLFIGFILPAAGMNIQSASQDNEARAVYEEMDRRINAVVFETATMTMRIVDNRGRVRERELESWSHNDGPTTRTLMRFHAPADVRGTGLLTISEGDAEVQRLFLPALNRIQTITSTQRADRFMGSDFTYEDLGDQNPDDFTFSVLERDRAAAQMLVKGIRTNASGYAYAHFLIDTRRYVLLRATYFDTRDEKVRELVAENITEIRPEIWRASKLTMRDLKTGRYTELIWQRRTIDEPIDAQTFTERNLQRVR
jgi:hypothetical protein